jgi:quinol---cytochrome c reductase iron-sulfur subunit, bacillus type
MTVSEGRRTFFKWIAAAGGLVTIALAGFPAVRAFFSPVFRRRRPENWIRLGDTSRFTWDEPVKIDFVDEVRDAWVEARRPRNVWVYTTDGERFTVYSGRCTHLGCNFAFDAEKTVFRCPCHMGFFDVKTGAVLGGPPPRPLDALETKIEGGVLYVRHQEFRLGVPAKVEA